MRNTVGYREHFLDPCDALKECVLKALESFSLTADSDVYLVLYLLADYLCSHLNRLSDLLGQFSRNDLELILLEVVRGHLEVVYYLHSSFLDLIPVAVKDRLEAVEHLVSGVVDLNELLSLFISDLLDLLYGSVILDHKFVVSHHKCIFLHYDVSEYLGT